MNKLVLTFSILIVLTISSFNILQVNAQKQIAGDIKVTFHYTVNCLPTPDVKTKIFDNEQITPIAKGISTENGNLVLWIPPNLDYPLPLSFLAQTENDTHSLYGNFFDVSYPNNITIYVNWGTPC